MLPISCYRLFDSGVVVPRSLHSFCKFERAVVCEGRSVYTFQDKNSPELLRLVEHDEFQAHSRNIPYMKAGVLRSFDVDLTKNP